MALKKQITDDEGRTIEYWRVSPCFSFDVVSGELSAPVMPYASQAARQAGKRTVHLSPNPGNDPPFHAVLSGNDALTAVQTGDPRPALYASLKVLGFFTGSEDV